jgi:GT2 family glycosyltransferase
LKAAVVIPTFGRPGLARAAALSALAQDGDFDVHVVDDGGQDGTRAALEALNDSRLHYHWMEHAGPAAARNFGANQAADAGVLAFLDSDTLAQPGWLAAGLRHLEENPGLFGVEGKVLPDVERAATPFTEAVVNPHGGRWLTCNLFVRRDAFMALGGFDERFTEPCREDSEFAFRAQEAGHRFEFEPAALVLHPVREVRASRAFHHAREGRFEALIERRHPAAYRRHFKWLDGRQAPVYYGAHVLALLLVFFHPFQALGLWCLGAGAVLYAWTRKRRARWTDFLKLLPAALFAPYARLGWVAFGYLKYPASPDKSAVK